VGGTLGAVPDRMDRRLAREPARIVERAGPFGALFSEPALELQSIDVRDGTATFGRMTPSSYADSVFLNLRGLHRRVGGERTWCVPLGDLLSAFLHEARPVRPIHFVFHNAFCCSTLLTRCLDGLSRGFTLREPNALRDFVWIQRSGWPVADRAVLLDCVLALLARTFSPAKTAFVKANDLCNAIIEDILERRPGSGALLLYGDLDTFVSKSLKNEQRVERTMRVSKEVIDRAHGPDALRAVDDQHLSPAQAAALCWVAHAVRFREVLERTSEARIASLDYRELLRNPASVLRAYLALCGMTASEDDVAKATSDEVVGQYSKQPRRAYGAADHEQELEHLRERLTRELREAHRWVEANGFADCHAPFARPLQLTSAP
jgi:hypothetical protein